MRLAVEEGSARLIKWCVCVCVFAARPRPQQYCATMYQHYHYRGRQVRMNSGQSLNYFPHIRFNDQLSAVRVRRGCTLQVFEHVHYRGRRLTFNSRSTCCFRGWWNDKASSARCTCRGGEFPCEQWVEGLCAGERCTCAVQSSWARMARKKDESC